MTDTIVVLVTVPSREQGEALATLLLDAHLAACVNVVGPVRSIYRWGGKVCADDEHLLVIKTTQARYAALEDRVLAAHPYEVPEIIALPIEAGATAYLEWLRKNTGGTPTAE
jgi:periplasmic divalent cation tolerance protein